MRKRCKKFFKLNQHTFVLTFGAVNQGKGRLLINSKYLAILQVLGSFKRLLTIYK